MPYTIKRNRSKKTAPSFAKLTKPLKKILKKITPLRSRGNRALKMTFEDQLNALIYFHLEEHSSGRHLLQSLKEDEFAREHIAPEQGIEKSSFFEAVNTRGLPQLLEVFNALCADARRVLPKEHTDLGDLTVLDSTLIDATLSMYWADYRKEAKKAKGHVGFDLNHSIPSKIFLSNGKGDEKPFASQILAPGQTGIMDRMYQCHKCFDQWQQEGKYFLCRLRNDTIKKLITVNAVQPDSIVFYDGIVLLGVRGKNQTEEPLRLVGYKVDGVDYWIATNRYDLTAEQIAMIYRLRWNIEVFFAWWKRHLKVYHLIARSRYGLMVQMLGGLITYILLAIYCHNEFGEKVSIKRVRQLRIKIINESRAMQKMSQNHTNPGTQKYQNSRFAKT